MINKFARSYNKKSYNGGTIVVTVHL